MIPLFSGKLWNHVSSSTSGIEGLRQIFQCSITSLNDIKLIWRLLKLTILFYFCPRKKLYSLTSQAVLMFGHLCFVW